MPLAAVNDSGSATRDAAMGAAGAAGQMEKGKRRLLSTVAIAAERRASLGGTTP
uniref:Uncharacterized protein n=1 Tax=Triticum urartu TaxID=4572 RepID=A0A8R7R473_TRIUA